MELIGTITEIGNTEQKTDSFRKRDLVLDISEQRDGTTYTNVARLETHQAKTDILNNYSVGQQVKVYFNIKGRRSDSGVFQSLVLWKIEKA